MHFIFSVSQNSTTIFSEAPDPNLTGAKGNLSMDFNRLLNRCVTFLALTGNSGAINFELSPVFMSFPA